MRIHVVLDLEREDIPGRTTYADLMVELEAELEALNFNVDEAEFTATVAGIGLTVKDVAESLRLRSKHA